MPDMNTTRFCALTNISPNTFRLWTRVYGQFLSPSGAPAKGKTRNLTPLDQRILLHVHTLRGADLPIEEITARLRDLQSNGWRDLPELPPEWTEDQREISVELATARAGEIAEIAVLRTELENTRENLAAARALAESLQQELVAIRSRHESSEEKAHDLELRLSEAQGTIRTLEARLAGYALGGEKPVNLLVIIGVALLIGAVLVALAVVLGALVG